METAFPQQRIALAIGALIVGAAVSWSIKTPFGLLAPMAALFLFARGRATMLLHASLMIALVGMLLVAAFYSGATRDLAVTWAAFFALALCIGAIVATGVSAPLDEQAVHAMRIVESMPAYTWFASPDGRRTYVSSSTLSYVGLPAAESRLFHSLDNAGWRRIVHPDDYDKIIERRCHSLETGLPYDTEYRIRRRDGAYRWVRSFGAASRDGEGRIVGWYGTMIDIEEQKRAEATLRDRERELSQFVDMAPSHLWRLTPDGESIFFSKRMVDFLGIDLANADKPGTSRLEVLIETVHPDDAPTFRDALGRCLATGESFSLRYRLRRADGIYRWMSSRAEPLRNKQGRIVQWYGLCHDIEDRMQAEDALRRSERKLRQMIDAVPTMIWSTGRDGTPTYVNKRFSDVTGATLQDITAPDGSPSLSVIHPDFVDEARRAARHSFATGELYVQRYRQLRADGSYRWTETRAEPLRDEDGAVLQWYGVSVDVHDMVMAQAALREREQELSQLVDMVPSLLWRLHPDGEPAFFSRRMVEFFGLDIEDAGESNKSRLAAILEAVIHPDDAASVGKSLRHSLVTGERFSMKYRLRRADGVYRWVDGHAEPLRDQSGRIVQWYGLSHDIDDQMHIEEALRERERFLWQLVETLPAMIDCASPDGEPIYRSQQLRAFLGYDLEALDDAGKLRLVGTLDAGVHPDDVAGVKTQYAHSLQTGEPYARRHRLRRFDGEYRWVETRAAPMRNAEGAIVQWNVICLDIDGQVRAEENLRLAQESLARASQSASLAELSASIAHEVNQPLAAIVANSHACQRWLAATPPNVERAKITAERIVRDANAAADVVSRIRALFKQSLEARTSTTFGSVVAEVRSLMADEATRRRVRMDIEVENELPLIAFDRVQIQQVLINLIRNGMDAMEEAGEERVLGIRAGLAGEVVRIAISDRGPGIELPDRIFEPFFTTKEHGMGMGLAICRSIVESHGGRLWVERGEPCGAKFIFTLPVDVKLAS